MYCVFKNLCILLLNTSHFIWAIFQVVNGSRWLMDADLDSVAENIEIADIKPFLLGLWEIGSRKRLGRYIPSPKPALRSLGEEMALAHLGGKGICCSFADLGWEVRKPCACMWKNLKGNLPLRCNGNFLESWP